MQSSSAPNSVPPATRQRIQESTPFTPTSESSKPSENSSGYETVSSSWASTRGMSSEGIGPDRPPLAWAGVRHQLGDDSKMGRNKQVVERATGRCTQAVLLTCLYLSHEMIARDVGLYAWTLPATKEPYQSMLKIMKRYAEQLRLMTPHTASLIVRTAPDPSKNSIQHHLQQARLAAGNDTYVAVLYSGHGIAEPPTEAGELWCYDRSFEECAREGGAPSEYIPIILFSFLSWAGAATCFVWDCHHAGRIIRAAIIEVEEMDTQLRAAAVQNPAYNDIHPAVFAQRQIHFAACGSHQTIPRIPGMPDDLFTACLTTPLRVALLYHNLQTFPLTTSRSMNSTQRSSDYMFALWQNMSQSLKDRLWSELEAILHTIAWQTLDGDQYQLLFGQSGDAVSTLAGGFILSQRVMATYRVTPESIPPIPSSNAHALWTHWDLILENLYEQLPDWFDESPNEHAWEENIKLVSFMADQLESILSSEQAIPIDESQVNSAGPPPTLSRLPIICQAALTEEYRVNACSALNACLRNLDVSSLYHAIQGGALNVASHLLVENDSTLTTALISIWASLVRHDGCVGILARWCRLKEEEKELSPCATFFLNNLETNLVHYRPEAIKTITETAAILSTIIQYQSSGCLSQSSQRVLKAAGQMLEMDEGLMQQWGALLIGEMLECYVVPEHIQDLVAKLKAQILAIGETNNVDIRAASVYALARWVPFNPVTDICDLQTTFALSRRLVRQSRSEGSPLVRHEFVRFFQRLLHASGHWVPIILSVWMLDIGYTQIPSQKAACKELITRLSDQADITGPQLKAMFQVHHVIKALDVARSDSDMGVSQAAWTVLREAAGNLPQLDNEIVDAALPKGPAPATYTIKALQAVLQSANILLDRWFDAWPTQKAKIQGGSGLLERSKRSLQIHLLGEKDVEPMPEQLKGQPESSKERIWIHRHRILEDSLVVADQQKGLPWKWAMKDIKSPEPWSTVTFHSYLNTVMSCNNSNRLSLWDWSSSRKTGSLLLDIPSSTKITSARFVNELHESLVVLAEIDNGAVHVLAGPADEPTQMKTISSFSALNLNGTTVTVGEGIEKKLVSSWWRQSGKLCVGGVADVVNVWDCPAERCVRVLDTESSVPMTTLITEPVSGNLQLAGFADGQVKLYDLRQARKTPLISWLGGQNELSHVDNARPIVKIGVVLGESKHITSACSNGMINIHDLRSLSQPTSSILVQPNGIASASFQAHSGLMSTVSNLNTSSEFSAHPRANFGLYRSTLSMMTSVTEETVTFGEQDSKSESLKGAKPYTVVHALRPFLGIGYGTESYLRGAGVGKGDDTDSGSYSFLRAQTAFGQAQIYLGRAAYLPSYM